MNVDDALYHLVHDYPGSAGSLAPRMGLKPATLYSMANPQCERHEWPLKRFRQAIALTGDKRPLDALCAEFGGVFLPLGEFADIGSDRLLKAASKLAREFGDVPRKLQEITADGRVKPRELDQLKREVYEMTQAGAALVKLVERLCEQHATLSEDDRP